MPILQAIVDGKTIQHKTINRGWYYTNVASLDHLVTYYKDYRIKPEPRYRPFRNAKECWEEMQKHQPFGWIKCDEGYLNITYVGDEQVYLADPDGGAILLDSKNSYQDNTFVDGTPFGVKVEE